LAPKPAVRRGGRRFAAVVAILGQPCLQLLHTRNQLVHLLAQRGVPGFRFGDPGFGVWRHASGLHVLRKSA